MADLATLARVNAQRWANAKLERSFLPVAQHLVAEKSRYQTVTRMAGVPWWIIAVIHERESSQNWNASLAQGDPWNAKSVHVPRDRGPFDSWEAAACDALVNCPPFASRWKDWSSGGALTLLETYNGLGYANKGIPSPYIWAGTDQYVSGKYVADGQFDPHAVDRQLGCAGLIKTMRALDSTIGFADEMPAPPDIPPIEPKPVPQPAAPGGFFNALVNLIFAIFKRK